MARKLVGQKADPVQRCLARDWARSVARCATAHARTNGALHRGDRMEFDLLTLHGKALLGELGRCERFEGA